MNNTDKILKAFREEFKHSQFVKYGAIEAFLKEKLEEAYQEGYNEGYEQCMKFRIMDAKEDKHVK